MKVNGREVELDVKPNELLINTLRGRLGLTSVKYGCGIGECGACTVLVDGEPVLACLTLTVDVNGREVTTVEGLSADSLTEVQRAFIEEGAVQCGYCTPAFVLISEYALRTAKTGTVEELKKYLSGVLCRCTGYTNILRALRRLAIERGFRIS